MNDLSNRFGSNLSFPASEFTRDMQEHIINSYFNGTPTAYETIQNELSNRQNEQQVPQQVMQTQYQQQPVQTQQYAQIDPQELERLRNIERLVKETPPQVYQNPRMTQPQQVQQSEPQQQQNDLSFEQMMQDILGTGATQQEQQVTQQQVPQQPTQQTQSQNQVNETDAIVAELSREAMLNGIQPDEVIGFLQGMSAQDIVKMYMSSRQPAQPQQTYQQQPQQVQQVQQPVQAAEQRYNAFGFPVQNTNPINIVDIPSATQQGVNLAFPPVQRHGKSIFD